MPNPAPTSFPPRFTPRHPWRPITNPEWAALSHWLTPASDRTPRDRPPEDPRQTWDAVFWVACSSGPWSDLPPDLGKPDTAHRTLRCAATRGRLAPLLFLLARRADRALQSLEWCLARAYRRVFRVLPGTAIGLAQRLGLLSALPCHPAFMPRPDWGDLLLRAARLILADPRRPISPGNHTLLDICIRRATGEPRRWRTTD